MVICGEGLRLEISFHPRQANVVVDALSHKVISVPIEDMCLRMVIISPLLDLIKEALVEGLRMEKWKA